MSVKSFLAVFAVLALAFGIGFVLVPAALGDIYGVEQTAATHLMGRFFGGALLAWGLILWLARDFDAAAQRAVMLASAIADAVSMIVAAGGTISGVTNALGWSTVLIYLIGAVGSAYYLTAGTHRTSLA